MSAVALRPLVAEEGAGAGRVRDLIRLALLVPLALAALVAVTLASAPNRSVADFRAAVDAGRIEYVRISGTGENQKALWTTNWVQWSTTHASDTDGPRAVDLRSAVADRNLESVNGARIRPSDLTFVRALGWLRMIVVACYVLSFLLMLRQGGGWIGNRWFWFWPWLVMRPTAALAVPLLYLVLEPRPLWWFGGKYVPAKPALGGVAGCLFVLPLGFALLLADLALVSLLNLL